MAPLIVLVIGWVLARLAGLLGLSVMICGVLSVLVRQCDVSVVVVD